VIEAIVRSLEDGQWHALSEIKKGLSLTEDQCDKAISFLRKFGLAELDVNRRRIRLDARFLELPL